MIKYTRSPSPFYFENENYCKRIENELTEAGIIYSGRCDAWGYEILADFERKRMSYHLQCIKQQSTNSPATEAKGVVYSGIEINGKGFDRSLSLQFEKNTLMRLWMSSEIKKITPSPFYFSHNIKSQFTAQPLIDFCIANQFSKLKIKNGKIKLLMHVPANSPLNLISQLEKLLEANI